MYRKGYTDKKINYLPNVMNVYSVKAAQLAPNVLLIP